LAGKGSSAVFHRDLSFMAITPWRNDFAITCEEQQ